MAKDRKDIVTPDAFSVAPELLGKPIASPWRRLGAMLVDLVAIGLLSSLPGIVFGIAAAAVLTRAAFRPHDAARPLRRRVLLAVAVAVLGLFVTATVLDRRSQTGVKVSFGGEQVAATPADAVGMIAEAIALRTAETDDERAAAATALVDHVRAVEPDDERVREIAEGIAGELADPLARAALADAFGALPRRPEPRPPSPEMLRRYADVLASDPPAAETLRAEVAESVAVPEIAAARRRTSLAEAEVRELRDKVAELSRPAGVLGWLQGVADDLGLGLGWTALYFTGFTAWWGGRTPGKRLFGCRIARLDGRPLTPWQAFNRAGGYAASFATGLLGFAEILWDPNRQALHDRICGTVVLRDGPDA